MDGRISAAAQLALVNQLPLPMMVKRDWSGFPGRGAIQESMALAIALYCE